MILADRAFDLDAKVFKIDPWLSEYKNTRLSVESVSKLS